MGRLLFTFLLVLGLGVGVVGIKNRYDIRSGAQTPPNTGVCDLTDGQFSGSCSQKPPGSSWPFLNTNGSTTQVYCCKIDEYISDGMTRNRCLASTTPGCPSGGGPVAPQPGTQPPPAGYQPCGSCNCRDAGVGDRGSECQINDKGACVWNPGYCGTGGGGTSTPKRVCGESCNANSDCGAAGTPGITVVCRNNICENSACPVGQTTFGANCACGAARQCGQRCGADVGTACTNGICTYVNTGSNACPWGWGETYCVPNSPNNGYQRLACASGDTGGGYLQGPGGVTTGMTISQLLAACGVGGNAACPVGGTTGRLSTAGGPCKANSDCRAPSGGGSAVCTNGLCANSSCPAGRTLPGAAYLCAGGTGEVAMCGQKCYAGNLCAPGQGVCRYVNTGGNNCPWGWGDTYCSGTANGFSTPQCGIGDTGGAYLMGPGSKTTGLTLSDVQKSCQVCGDGIIQTGEECDDGTANGSTSSVCGVTCKITNCLVPSAPTPVATPVKTPTPSSPPAASCPTLFGSADGFNLFVLNDLNHSTTDTEGKVAVGGNATFNKYNLGKKLTNPTGTLISLVVGGNLKMTETRVENGSATYAGTATITTSQFVNGSAKKAAPSFSFATAGTTLNTTASTWASYAQNGTVNTVGDLTFTGTNTKSNVFKVAGTELAKARKIRITAPASSTVLINVTGTNVTVFGHQFILTNIPSNRIVYNFYEASTLKVDRTSVLGSVFAPKANFTFVGGRVEGMVVVKSLGGDGQINNGQINNSLPGACPTKP